MTTTTMPLRETVGVTREERKVIFASSLGTVFEWYDFFLYGSLAAIIGATFFGAFPPATQAIFALLAFAAGSLVRTFGALVFGRVGDLVGRKHDLRRAGEGEEPLPATHANSLKVADLLRVC
jgi:MFS family permease